MNLTQIEHRSKVRIAAGERGIWQRHYWEHLIRDEADYQRHIDYVHFNPVKHQRVQRVADWPYSTFHRYVAQGIYPVDWCGDADFLVDGDECCSDHASDYALLIGPTWADLLRKELGSNKLQVTP